MAADLRFEYEGTDLLLAAEKSETGWRVRLPGGAEYEVGVRRDPEGAITVAARLNGSGDADAPRSVFAVPYSLDEKGIVFSWKGQSYRFSRAEQTAAHRPRPRSASGSVMAPTSGVVADILVEVGQEVVADQQLAVIESMKVMTPIDSPFAGCVRQLFLARGQRIDEGAPAAIIEPTEPAAPDSGAEQ